MSYCRVDNCFPTPPDAFCQNALNQNVAFGEGERGHVCWIIWSWKMWFHSAVMNAKALLAVKKSSPVEAAGREDGAFLIIFERQQEAFLWNHWGGCKMSSNYITWLQLKVMISLCVTLPAAAAPECWTGQRSVCSSLPPPARAELSAPSRRLPAAGAVGQLPWTRTPSWLTWLRPPRRSPEVGGRIVNRGHFWSCVLKSLQSLKSWNLPRVQKRDTTKAQQRRGCCD